MVKAQPTGTETLFGHPKGLMFLAMTEAWERFSFYGMRALLILYMVQELLLPGRIEGVAGMDAYRGVIEGLFGPLSTQAFASQTFGLYAGFVYFTPLFGGLIADRWLGAKKTVMIGIALMTAGHFAMAFDASFLLALLLLVLGSGCLKGNIAAQVGHLYPRQEEALRSRGYTIFSTGINIGAVIGPLACGLVAQVWGWHYGFGLAGVMMLVAAAVYFAGLRHFAEEKPVAAKVAAGNVAAPLTGSEWKMIALVVTVMFMIMFQFLAYDQMYNVGMIWVADQVVLDTALGTVPVPWFASADALSAVIVVPFLIALWRAQARRDAEPGDLGKMAVGAAIMAASMGVLALGDFLAGEAKTSIIYPALAFSLTGIAFMWTWPTMLALTSRRAPAKVNALMMASAYLTAFVTSVGAGYVARFYEAMGAWQFFAMNALVSLGGAVLFVLLGPWLKRRMDGLDEASRVEA